MSIKQALYPPILDAWLPAIPIGEDIIIYFTLSAYSNLTDIRQDIILVDIVNSVTNENVVNYIANAGSRQLAAAMQVDDNQKYFIKINTRLINVDLNNTYKVQLRFCSSLINATAAEIQANPKDDRWSSLISDYSKVSLIKIIPCPHLELQGFIDVGTEAQYIISTAFLSIVGKLNFGEIDTDEVLESYQIEVYESETGADKKQLLLKTDVLYPNSKEQNIISYTLKRDLKNKTYYLMTISYKTNNGYYNSKDFRFFVSYEYTFIIDPPQISVNQNTETGAIEVFISGAVNYQGYYILRRTSSLSNFLEWDDLKYFYKESDSESIDQVVEDYLVQPGVIYRYQVIPLSANGYRQLWTNIPQNNPGETLEAM